MAESKDIPERVAPRINLVLCAGRDRGWVDRTLAELEAARGITIEVVVVAAGPAATSASVRWIEVEETASASAMRNAGSAAVGEGDVIWFEYAPNPVDWFQLTGLATVGIVGPAAPVQWAARLETLGVDNPSQEGPKVD